ncbi:hypothetical protein MES5069_350035 [Mesorhizobium escarrei]|uniref:Uncharacterized protein n=1 Tax=Mesorhizobium escarrei TaxID=666018 RepID=A0ABN8K0M0_9HYPH|nr:hypothetical protein MES5069_350035 [Mesorhizobium escarrei]
MSCTRRATRAASKRLAQVLPRRLGPLGEWGIDFQMERKIDNFFVSIFYALERFRSINLLS